MACDIFLTWNKQENNELNKCIINNKLAPHLGQVGQDPKLFEHNSVGDMT